MQHNSPWEDRWVLDKHLGSGGHGASWRCHRVEDARMPFVLKRLLEDHQESSERRARMNQEVVALENLKHSGIPQFVEGNTSEWRTDTELYFVMEYIDGFPLHVAIEKFAPTPEQSIQTTQALLEIVEHCHARGVLHRDIKPDNIVLRGNSYRNPVLIDFGLTYNAHNDDQTITPRGQDLGNRFLRLPELHSGAASTQDRRSPLSDLTFCCGILFYMLTGEKPGNLLDADGHKPHQRDSAKVKLQSTQGINRTALLELFDQAFETPLSRRWQSTGPLQDALKQVATPPSGHSILAGNPEEQLAVLGRALRSQSTRANAISVQELLATTTRTIINAHREIPTHLKEALHFRQTSRPDFARGNSSMTLELIDPLDATAKVAAIFEATVTGSELVIGVNGRGQRETLLRTPLDTPLQVTELRSLVLSYFTRELQRVQQGL